MKGTPVEGNHAPGGAMLTHALRATGWLFIVAGLLVVLYLTYSLLFTNTFTAAAQRELLEEWKVPVEAPSSQVVAERPAFAPPTPASRERSIPEGDAVALIEFRRPGSDASLVHDGPLAIVEGVTTEPLKRGPGHYPGTASPGQSGNFAVAGHRTTYGAPFFHLDQLQPGDVVDVTDRDGTTWSYTIRRQEVVEPDATWTLGPDPLGTGKPTLTLTTCYPRFSDEQRLIVFAELAATTGT